MTRITRTNREAIIEVQGELKVIKNDINNIKNNHLKHLDYKICQIQKVLWVVFVGVLSQLLWLIQTNIFGG